jgi:hypothetical protein
VIEKARGCLRPGGAFALNVADVRERGGIYPVVAEAKRVAALAGFTLGAELQMPLATLSLRHSSSEPVLIFR